MQKVFYYTHKKIYTKFGRNICNACGFKWKLFVKHMWTIKILSAVNMQKVFYYTHTKIYTKFERNICNACGLKWKLFVKHM